MRRLFAAVLFMAVAAPAFPQTTVVDREAELGARLPYTTMAVQVPDPGKLDYVTALRLLAARIALLPPGLPRQVKPTRVAALPEHQSLSWARIPPPLPALPPVPRITYPTTGRIYEWEAAHLRPGASTRR
jgi:hypothetical protein